ncbi:aminotransferase class I/II-fold pyridoxal phosphate-dependent enzyme [Solicola gregarius]|uniref:Aminotransferase n=1 Tax=Solicola gregarius TaxID=2908642 RepID=A0AA46YM23_9ACTN|nr:aminotransferase class I/II-fold pyridoxal phosphate-dependent enzyme [Solicola gregarius]UYM07257.1 aminotransferase class I/II-fold pyridoxal phosphate-dependent enzyme [Solicola gregarius]
MFQRFELENWQSAYEQTVRFNLADSTLEPVRLGELLDDPGDLDELLGTALYYPEVNGERALREVIAGLYPDVGADDVLVTVGASEANAAVVDVLCGPGDDVIVMQPGYQQVWGLATNNGCNVREFPLDPDDGWRPDLDALESLAGTTTKLIYVCNPNNPSGYVLTEEEIARIVAIAERYGAWILADEVYQGSERAARKHAATFVGRYDKVIGVNSMSKTYGLSGLRIGWAIARPDMIEQLWRRHEYAVIATGRIDNALARLALSEPRRGGLLKRNREAMNRGWDVLRAWAADNADVVTVHEPEATGLAFVRYHLELSSVEVGHAIREGASVLVCPGVFFGIEGHLRINFGFGVDYVRAALAATTPVLQGLAGR